MQDVHDVRGELHETVPRRRRIVQLHVRRMRVLDHDDPAVSHVRQAASYGHDLIDARVTAVIDQDIDRADPAAMLRPKFGMRLIADDDFKAVRFEPLCRGIEIDTDDPSRGPEISAPSLERSASTDAHLDKGDGGAAVFREQAFVHWKVVSPLFDVPPGGAKMVQQIVSHCGPPATGTRAWLPALPAPPSASRRYHRCRARGCRAARSRGAKGARSRRSRTGCSSMASPRT